LQVAELGSGAGIDRFRQNTGLRHIGCLFAGDVDALPRVVEGARHTLARSRIDALHFRVGRNGVPPPVELARYGYAIFRLTETMPARVEHDAALDEGSYVAVQERLVSGFLGVPAETSIVELCREHGIQLRGVVDVGAHEGGQLSSYEAAGVEPIVLIEANPAVYARLVEAARGHPDVVTANRAIADKAGTSKLYLASSDKSASLLPMLGYREVYPQIAPVGSIDVECATLAGVLADLDLDAARFNVLNIGVQGAEAMVLMGARELLRHVEAVAVEVNFFELQKGCAQIEQIDEILEGAGFRRVSTMSVSGPSWADAFYVRR
jgi:FkbM family methyltransferase